MTERKNRENDPFVSEEVCTLKHKQVDEKLDCYALDIKSINKKINATLIFAIVILTTVLIEILKNGLH